MNVNRGHVVRRVPGVTMSGTNITLSAYSACVVLSGQSMSGLAGRITKRDLAS